MSTDTDTSADPVIAPHADGLTHDRITELGRMLEHHPDSDSWFYTGPLEEGQTLAHRYAYSAEFKNPVGHTVVVFGGHPDPTWEDHNSYGRDPDPDRAWRYALGAEFGPPPEDDE